MSLRKRSFISVQVVFIITTVIHCYPFDMLKKPWISLQSTGISTAFIGAKLCSHLTLVIKKYEEAEAIFIEIIEYVKMIDDQELLGIVYYDAGFIKSRQNRHKEALEYFKSASAPSIPEVCPLLCIVSL